MRSGRSFCRLTLCKWSACLTRPLERERGRAGNTLSLFPSCSRARRGDKNRCFVDAQLLFAGAWNGQNKSGGDPATKNKPLLSRWTCLGKKTFFKIQQVWTLLLCIRASPATSTQIITRYDELLLPQTPHFQTQTDCFFTAYLSLSLHAIIYVQELGVLSRCQVECGDEHWSNEQRETPPAQLMSHFMMWWSATYSRGLACWLLHTVYVIFLYNWSIDF